MREHVIGMGAACVRHPLKRGCACHEPSFGLSIEQLIADKNRLCSSDNGALLILSKPKMAATRPPGCSG
jgi:hypothetical protein